jgi:predicted pyridoxine 5'-phosphate oxidase superfamily flavin-nucleotide-binding protein
MQPTIPAADRPDGHPAGVLTADMRRVVEEQRLGFVATVCPDGTPNLSPKGTVAVWDGDHLVFADIRSPGTIRNLRHNPAVEVNVVDPIARKGYRFKGTGEVYETGPLYDDVVAFFRRRGSQNAIRAVVLIRVARALPLTSPAYDLGYTEDDVRARWLRHHDGLQGARAGTPAASG